MRCILAAVPDLPEAEAVVAVAQAIAPLFDATVDAVHVLDGGARLAEAAAGARGVPLRTVAGDPVARLAREAARDEVVAVVCGAGHPSDVSLRGGVALALAATLEKPIVVVPPETATGASVERVLIAIKGTATSAVALKRAVELPAAAGLDVVVVHVDDEDSVPSFSDQAQYEAELYAEEFLARYVPGAPQARLSLRIGDPAQQVLAAAQELGVDLIAAGWPHTSDPARGDVARQLLQRSRVPVLLVATTASDLRRGREPPSPSG